MDLLKEWGKKIAVNYDGDSFDRLRFESHIAPVVRYIYTNYAVLGVAFFVFAKSYVGEAVQCWVPPQFKVSCPSNEKNAQGGWESYVENYCLIENSYFSNGSANEGAQLPALEERPRLELLYYQWVPFILCGIALSLYAPRALWKSLYNAFGYTQLKAIMRNLHKGSKELETPEVELLMKKGNKAQHLGSRLTFCLLISKVFALVILVLNLAFLNFILGNDYRRFWGVSVFWSLLSGRKWETSGNFPRVTFCDVEVKELGDVNRWTFQCVLMVNMFNEKVCSANTFILVQFFLLLWLWFLLLFVGGIVNLLVWIFRTFIASSRNSFVHELLVMGDAAEASVDEAGRLVDRRLGIDGVTLLRLTAHNASAFLAADQLRRWKNVQGNGEHAAYNSK